MASFGKKGQETVRFPAAARPLAGSPVRPPLAKQSSPHVIYREGESERPTQNSFPSGSCKTVHS